MTNSELVAEAKRLCNRGKHAPVWKCDAEYRELLPKLAAALEAAERELVVANKEIDHQQREAIWNKERADLAEWERDKAQRERDELRQLLHVVDAHLGWDDCTLSNLHERIRAALRPAPQKEKEVLDES